MLTAEVLEKDEWLVSIYPPGYLFYGINSRVTLGWDWWGVFLRIIAFDLRYQLVPETPVLPAITLDYYSFYLPKYLQDYQRVEQKYGDLFVAEKGTKQWIRINISKKLWEKSKVHFSGGYTYGDYLELYSVTEKKERIKGDTYKKYWTPSVSIGLEYRKSKRIKGIIYWSGGDSILNYLDQAPFKTQLGLGVNIAPFVTDKYHLNNLRMELGVIQYNLINESLQMTMIHLSLISRF